jgi:hypothetical protein
MLRSLSFAAAIAAVLVIPFTDANARHGGMSGGSARMGSFSGARSFSAGPRMSAGPRFSSVRSFSTVRSVNRVNVIGSRRVAFIGPRFRHRGFFGFYPVGLYGSCWRWVPTVYGLRRVWVCDPYYPYAY